MKNQQLHKLAALFGQKTFEDIIASNNFSTFDNIIRQHAHHLVGNLAINCCDEVYQQLVDEYPCEYVVKNELINESVFLDSHFCNEQILGGNIIDLAEYRSSFESPIAYEIKTKFDTPRRMRAQIDEYAKFFLYCYLIVPQEQTDYYVCNAPENAGVISYTKPLDNNRLCFHWEKQAPSNPTFCIETAMNVLRTEEITNVVNQLGHDTSGIYSYDFTSFCKQKLKETDPELVRKLCYQVITDRYCSEEKARMPFPLRQLALSLHLTKHIAQKLIDALYDHKVV